VRITAEQVIIAAVVKPGAARIPPRGKGARRQEQEVERPTMQPSVYLETSIIGYLTSRPSRDLITAANQQMTREWWDDHRQGFEVFV